MQDTQQATLPVGSILRERYVIEGLLGKGGYGSVYLVRDLRVKGNLYALKETSSPDKIDQQRFLFEAELLKKLDHRALPRVYRIFDDDAGQRIYMLMDYIEGPNLEALRRQRPGRCFSLSQVLVMLAPIVDAAHYLHRQQPPILHRDIKPSNIIVPLSGEGTVLVDFGIAKEHIPDSTTTAFRTGSPGYAAPEQYSRGTSARSDIYALGATMYSLLAGTLPADALDRMTKTSSNEPDPLVPVNTLSPDVPQTAAKAIARAMALNSNNRFATVEQFWRAFSAQEAWQPLRAPGSVVPVPSTGPLPPRVAAAAPARARSRRFRPAFFLLLLLAMLLVAGTFAGYIFYTRGHPAASASEPTTQATVAVNTSPISIPTTIPTVIATAASTTSVPTSQPVIVPTAHPTPPSARPTNSPTPNPTPRPTPSPTPAAYPQIAGTYHGTIDDVTANIITSMSLSIQQSTGQSNITGYFTVNPPLIGSGNFNGTVNTTKYVQFVVQRYKSNRPLYFWGWVQSNGGLQGNYCSLNAHNQCDSNAGASGTWSVSRG